MFSKFYRIGPDTIDQSFEEIQKVIDLNDLKAMAIRELTKMTSNMNKMFEDMRKDFDNLF